VVTEVLANNQNHSTLKNYKKSLLYHQKSLQINTNLGLLKDQAKDYANRTNDCYVQLNEQAKNASFGSATCAN